MPRAQVAPRGGSHNLYFTYTAVFFGGEGYNIEKKRSRHHNPKHTHAQSISRDPEYHYGGQWTMTDG